MSYQASPAASEGATNEELVARYQSGDESALLELLAANEMFVFRVTRRYWHEQPSEDALQESRMALMNCAKLFNVNRGIKFTTYLYWAVSRRAVRLRDRQRREAQAYGVADDDESVMDWVPSRTATPDEQAMEHEASEESRRTLEAMIAILSPRAQFIVRSRLAGKTLKEISRKLGISIERVRQLYNHALRRMAH